MDGKKVRIEEIEKISGASDFWNDKEKAQQLLKEQSKARDTVEQCGKANAMLEDAEALLELAREESDQNSADEANSMANSINLMVESMEFARMLSGPNDKLGALVSINSGAGGTESQDWAEMLLRMYTRWCERRGYKVQELDLQPGDEAGIKSVTFSAEGEYAFGYLRAESGVHRLVRISPFDTQSRRHTSFASVCVFPDVEDDLDVDIRDDDLRIDFYRAGGAGGQHVNKTESAVRITHIPTGIVVQCQNERSQHKNKALAMRVLRGRVYEHERKRKEQEKANLQAEKKSIEWGSQIRSYVLAPYRLVTDHRTELKIGNVDAVLDGDLDKFIHTYLLAEGGASN